MANEILNHTDKCLAMVLDWEKLENEEDSLCHLTIIIAYCVLSITHCYGQDMARNVLSDVEREVKKFDEKVFEIMFKQEKSKLN